MTTALEKVRKLFRKENWGGEYGEGIGEDIWSLISALRGPDNGNNSLKERTTWRLRVAIAPQFFESISQLPPDKPMPPDEPNEGEARYTFVDRIAIDELGKEFPGSPIHFLQHYAAACWSFWKGQNEKTRPERPPQP